MDDAKLIDAYESAQRRIEQLLDAALATPSKRGRLIREVDAITADLNEKAERWAEHLRERWEEAMGAAMVGLVGVSAIRRSARRRDFDRLVDKALGDLTNAARTVGINARKVAAEIAKKGPDAARANIKAAFTKHDLNAIVYRNGARHTIDNYAEMVVRTISATIDNMAAVAAGEERGAKWFLITDGPDCGLINHTDTQKADGMIVDAAMAMTYPTAHPFCVRMIHALSDTTVRSLSRGLGSHNRTATTKREERRRSILARRDTRLKV